MLSRGGGRERPQAVAGRGCDAIERERECKVVPGWGFHVS